MTGAIGVGGTRDMTELFAAAVEDASSFDAGFPGLFRSAYRVAFG
ncbi:MAG TPA: hypothetical protein VL119_01630 [Acidimicrobiia bacterium]|nr:hypothetical protein [Acidimicrobiia bacterium]